MLISINTSANTETGNDDDDDYDDNDVASLESNPTRTMVTINDEDYVADENDDDHNKNQR